MKRWIVVVIIGAAAIAAWFFFLNRRTTPPVASPEKIAAEDSAVAAALAKQNTNTVAIIESNFARVQPASESSRFGNAATSSAPPGRRLPLQFADFAPSTVLENMSRAVRQYGQMFGGNPVGTNPEITSQLSGGNPKHINFINPDA